MRIMDPIVRILASPTNKCTGFVFLDRDGVINNVPSGHLLDVANIQIFDFVTDAITNFFSANYSLVIVTNQSCVARGTTTVNNILAINEEIVRRINKGSAICAYAICPHDDNDMCGCRKPKTGLITTVLHRLGHFDTPPNSWMIGDALSDIECGNKLGLKTILVSTGRGKQQKEYAINHGMANWYSCCNNLFEASLIIKRAIW